MLLYVINLLSNKLLSIYKLGRSYFNFWRKTPSIYIQRYEMYYKQKIDHFIYVQMKKVTLLVVRRPDVLKEV